MKDKNIYSNFVNGIAQEIKNAISNGGAGKWVAGFDMGGVAKAPLNVRGSFYSGANTLKLFFAQMKKGFKSAEWMTFKQVGDKGGQVIKGEKSTEVFFFTTYQKKDKETGEEETIFMPKRYLVFNKTQTTLAGEGEEVANQVNVGINEILDCFNPEIISHDQGAAFYDITNDIIKMPLSKHFKNSDDFNATLLHELAHWTGHKSRLGRFGDKAPTNQEYAQEELVAEISATVLMRHFNISGSVANHANYVAFWMRNLTDDHFAQAVKDAVKVINFILVANNHEQKEAA